MTGVLFSTFKIFCLWKSVSTCVPVVSNFVNRLDNNRAGDSAELNKLTAGALTNKIFNKSHGKKYAHCLNTAFFFLVYLNENVRFYARPCVPADPPVTPPLLQRRPRRAAGCLAGGRVCFLDQPKHGPPERRAPAGPARFWPDGHRP